MHLRGLTISIAIVISLTGCHHLPEPETPEAPFASETIKAEVLADAELFLKIAFGLQGKYVDVDGPVLNGHDRERGFIRMIGTEAYHSEKVRFSVAGTEGPTLDCSFDKRTGVLEELNHYPKGTHFPVFLFFDERELRDGAVERDCSIRVNRTYILRRPDRLTETGYIID